MKLDTTDPRALLASLFGAAVQAAQPARMLAQHLPSPPTAPGAKTLVLGAGKASAAMAQALEAAWPAEAPLHGLVLTRYGHTPPRAPDAPAPRIAVVEAAHPLPDAAGVQGAQRMLALCQGLRAGDLVIALMSGGASALLSLPVQWPGGGLTLADKQGITQALLHSGATIAEINGVRKHLSAIKGGRLALACAPARVLTLAISDVPGDDPATIGSGPTLPDPSTCAQALAVLRRYRIAVPAALVQQLEAGVLETPKPGAAGLEHNTVALIATPQQSLEAAAAAARAAGLAAHILSDAIEGESHEVGLVHAALARAVAQRGQPFAKPCVLLSGGETTVTLRPSVAGQARGRGGRASAFGLGLAQGLQGQPGVYALAADTDGIDGTEDNAGAFVMPDTLARAASQGLDVADHLARNDAYGFFAGLGDVFVTGPTYTNVNDFRALLVL